MTTTSSPVNDDMSVPHNANESNDSFDSFDVYFESTNEYNLLLNLHRIIPPTLVSVGCIGSAFTLAG